MRGEAMLPDVVRGSVLRKVAASTLVVLLVVGGLAAFVVTDVTADLKDQRQTELATVAEQEANALSIYFGEQRQRAILLSENGDFEGETSTANIRSSLQAQARNFDKGELYALHYIERSSRTIQVSTRPGTEGTSLSELGVPWRDGFRFEDANDAIVSRVHEAPGSETNVVAFVSPVEGKDAVIAVVMDAESRAEGFRDSIEGGYTQVVDSEGTVEFAERSDQKLTQYDAGSGATEVRRGVDGRSGVLERDGDVIAYAPVEGTDLVLVKHAPQANAYALSNKVGAELLVIVGAVVAGFVLLGLLVYWSVLTPVRDLTDKAAAVANGRTDATIEDGDRIDEIGSLRDAFRDTLGYLRTVTGQAEAIADREFDAPVLREDVPGRLGEALEGMQADLEEFITELERSKENARQAQTEAEDLARDLQQQAEALGTAMSRAADGDLTQRVDTDVDNDAMREIAVGFNGMLDELEATVVRIREFAAAVDESSEQVTASAREVENASEEVSRSVQEIADGAERQNGNIQQAAGEMSELSATIEEVASSTDEVARKSEAAATTGEEGQAAARQAAAELDEVESQTAATLEEVEALDDEVTEIGEIVDLIDDIAEQTNMLALNASIEAARADEAGEGFAVVADEIKGLAERTREATGEIETLIEDVQASTGDVVRDMRAVGERVSEGIGTAEEAIDALQEIVEQVEEANASIQSINDVTDDQAASTEEVVSMVDEVGSISEETASQAESAAAAAEEQTASLTEVTGEIDTLSERAADLRGLMDGFETREGGAGAVGRPGGPAGTAADDD